MVFSQSRKHLFKHLAAAHLLTVVLVKTKQHHPSKLVLVLYSQLVVLQKQQLLQNLSLELLYSTERQKNPSLLRLQKILQQLHYLETVLPTVNVSSRDLELLHSATIKKLLLVSYCLQQVLVHSVFLVALQRQPSNHLLQEQFLQISQVLQKQDTSKYSKTLFHLVHSHYLENLHIQTSITLQLTLVLVLLHSLEVQENKDSSEKLVLVLLPSLVHLLSDLQQTIWKAQSSSISRVHRHLPKSIRFTDTTETTEIQAHLVLLQSLVLVLQNQYKYLGTTETTKIQAHLEHLHSPIHLSYTHLSISHLRLVLVLQFFTRQVDQLSNPSPLQGTRVKEDSKDLLDLRNLSLVQLTLELVKLTPLVMPKQSMQSLKKVELMLS